MNPYKPIKIWRHADGRTIEVYPEYKVRYSGNVHARSTIRPGDASDEWPVLYRRDVPNLTDEEWQAAPFEIGWIATVPA